MTSTLWNRLRPFVLALVVAGVVGVPVFYVWRASFGEGTDIERLRRPATSADLPRVWFDGRVDDVPEPLCVVREETRRDKQWWLERPLQAVDVPIVHGGVHYLVPLAALSSDDARTTDDAVVRDAGAPRPNDDLRYRTVCASRGNAVWIDGCLAQDGVTINACSANEPLGALESRGGLEGERRERRSLRASAIWLGLVFLVATLFAWRATRAAGHRLLPLVRKSVTRAWAFAAVLPIVGLACVAALLGAPGLTVLFPPVFAVPFGYLLVRAARFRDVASQLEAPVEGMLVLEGTVGEESPLGPSVLEGRPVAASIVSVARVFRGGKDRDVIPVGEVQDRGRLEVKVGDETVKVEIDEAIFELAQDAEKELAGRDVPRELRKELRIDPEAPYRLREACIVRGDPITLLVDGRKVEGVDTSNYRMAPTKGYIEVGERSAVFEGTKAQAVARLLGKARTLDVHASLFGGMAYVGLGWALTIGWLTR